MDRYEQQFVDLLGRVHRRVRSLRDPAPAATIGVAGYLRRVCAVAIDCFCYLGYAFLGFLFIANPILNGLHKDKSLGIELFELAVVLLFMVAPFVILSPLLLARKGKHNGQTFGKHLLHIRVIRDDGKPWRFKGAFTREVVYKLLVPVGPSGILIAAAAGVHSLSPHHAEVVTAGLVIIALLIFLIFLLWPLRDPQRRGVHDLLAHSRVRTTAN